MAPMIHLGNADIVELMSMEETMAALRIGFTQLATQEAAHVPRMELWSPAAQEDAYYCLGSMAGTTKHFGVTAIRIKSDILHWPEGRRMVGRSQESVSLSYMALNPSPPRA